MMRVGVDVGRVNMYGVLAVSEDHELGVITRPVKEGEPPCYRGVTLDRRPWTCESPLYTAGTVRQWIDSHMTLMLWLTRHGALTAPLVDMADLRLETLAEEMGL